MRKDANITDPDAFYAALLDAHRDLNAAESAELDARLILLLANEIGDLQVLCECIAAARANLMHGRAPA